MKFPFLWISAAFGLGIILEKQIGFVFSHYAWTIFFTAWFLLWFVRGSKIFLPSGLILMMVLGYAHAGLVHQDSEKNRQTFLPVIESLKEDQFTQLVGSVASQPEVKTQGRKVTVSFILQAEKLRSKSVKGDVQIFLFQPPQIPNRGDSVRLWGKIEAPKGPKNPGEFDYQAYLKTKNIHFVFRGYGRSIQIQASAPQWMRFIFQTRNGIHFLIERFFRGNSRAVFKALITGSQKEISDSLRDDFMKTGTSHLLAVSGLNITLVVGSFFCLFLFIGMSQKLSAFVSLILVLIYTFIAGCGAPVLRAAWMSGCVFTAILFERQRSMLNALSFSFFILTLISPDMITQIGFQLSFLSVLGLMLFTIRWDSNWSWLESFQGTLAATLMTLPLILYYFHVLSFVSVIANLFAISIFHLAQMLCLLTLVFSWWSWAASGFAVAAAGILELGLKWIHGCSLLDWGYGYFPQPSKIQIFFYYLLLLGATLVWKSRESFKIFRWRIPRTFALSLLTLSWIFTASSFFYQRASSSFEWDFFSVGQNDLICVHSKNSVWLINTGRSSPSNQARWTLEPYLRSLGVKKIEAIILTDFDKKHWGGLETLARNFKIKKIFYPESSKRIHLRRRNQLPSHILAAPLKDSEQVFLTQDFSLKILSNQQGRLTLLFQTKEHRVLFLSELSDEKNADDLLASLRDVPPQYLYLFADGNYSKTLIEKIFVHFQIKKIILPSKYFGNDQIDLSKGGWKLDFGGGDDS